MRTPSITRITLSTNDQNYKTSALETLASHAIHRQTSLRMNQAVSMVMFSNRGAELDVWIRWLLALAQLDEQKSHLHWLPNAAGRYLQSEKGADAQNWHKDL